MEIIVMLRNKKGFTLIEILVSMVIFLIIFMGLFSALAMYTKINVQNSLRNAAINIAQRCVENLRAGLKCDNVTKDFRNFKELYVVNAPDPSSFVNGNNNVEVVVEYFYPPSKKHSYSIDTVIYK
ncbi:type IV pilus modification PilV family protein [Hippea jasoniae]|uniref:type IV pilus modification PilV family protein n=1 Tax=Hippea jasoniae TaxID=944479 RepID=UPI000A042874|nr:type II secretion system protein [Hippea jasoniae]